MNEFCCRHAASSLGTQARARKFGFGAGCIASLFVLGCSSSGQSNGAAGGVGGIKLNGGSAGATIGSGGTSASGGTTGAGGVATSGAPNSGGQIATSGAPNSGGQIATSGAPNSGGQIATSGGAVQVASGGKPSSGGGSGTAGGGGAMGGRPAAGGAASSGGSSTGGGQSSAGAAGAAGSGTAGSGAGGSPAVIGPCDLLASGSTPCVAAHSTVRLLRGAYSGPLYQVRRASDSKTQDIAFVASTGAAQSATQDTFCTGTTCTISIIYDQSGRANHLTRSQGGAEVCKHQDREAIADALPLTLDGQKVYGIKVLSDDNAGCTPPAGGEGTGYRLDKTSGIATGDDAETEYMVTSGETQAYQNSGCCFDYGNAETTDKDDGAATMEAIYFGGGAGWGHGGGSGPWVMADMENGIFSGSTSTYTGNTSVPYKYVTAILIGRAGGTYALKAGNAQSGSLTTMYDGARPNGYTKMKKQGAIILGTGGDNSDHGKGYFFEGVMTAGAASDAIMNQVQANIVAAGYGK